jgi:hypothetical protein
MDETAIKQVLAPYCPPLGHLQVDCIASKIVELSKSESKMMAAKVAVRRHKLGGKSRSRE